MSDNWNHKICTPCWSASNPDRIPFRVKWETRDSEEEIWCCFCGDLISRDYFDEDGIIFIRMDPKTTFCEDLHR